MTRVKEILKADSRYKEGLAVLEKAMKTEDQEAREKAIEEFSKLFVAVAYDRAEVYELLAFTLIQSADRLLRASYDILNTVKDNVKYNDRFKLTDAMGKLNKMINESSDENKDGLLAIKEEITSMQYCKETIVKDTAKLLEVGSVLSDK